MRAWLIRSFATIGVLVVLVVVAAVIVALLARDRVPAQTVLVIDFERATIEAIPPDPVARALFGDRMIVRDVVEALDRAAADRRVKGLIGRVGSGHGMAVTQEFRQAVARFRAAGKPALAYAETFGEVAPGNTGYYLATAFEEILLQPSGDIGLVGLIAETPFLRGTLEKLGLTPRLDHRHNYKTAMNTFTERAFTDAHREATGTIVDSLFATMVADIAGARGLTQEQLRALIARGPFPADEAVAVGLADGLAYRDEVYARLREALGVEFQTLGAARYLKAAGRPHRKGTEVALIHGTGQVVRGDSSINPFFGDTTMGADTLSKAFREAIEDDAIKAIVLRIDSPGGSYVASDAIWRMTELAREAGKPVVASMGDVAASGGYFVAMSADRIIAQPGTLTGSIGVVGGKFLTEDFWRDRLGITFDWVQSSDNAGAYSGLQDYTEHGAARHQQWLDRVYDDFVSKVGAGRNLSRDQVHEAAQGRVWTGQAALEIGLVDALGGYGEALAAVRELLELEPDAPLKLRVFPAERRLMALLRRGRDDDTVAIVAARRLFEGLAALRPMHHVLGAQSAAPGNLSLQSESDLTVR